MASRANQPNQPRRPIFGRKAAPTNAIPHVPVEPVTTGVKEPPRPPLSHAGAQQFSTAEGAEGVAGERVNVTDGETRHRLRPGEVLDDFYLSPVDLAAYNIPNAIPSCLADTDAPGDLVYIAIRAPERYDKLQPGQIRRKRHLRPSLQIVTNPQTGEPVYATPDLIFATVTREEYMGRVHAHTMKSEQTTRGIIEGHISSDQAQDGGFEVFRQNDEKFVKQKYMQSRGQLSTMKQNWPKQMSIQEIEEKVGAEATMRVERKFARGGRSEQPGEAERWQKFLKDFQAGKGSESGREKKYSLPGAPTR